MKVFFFLILVSLEGEFCHPLRSNMPQEILCAEIPSSHPKVMFDYSNTFVVDIYILNSLKFPLRMVDASLIS